MNSEDPSPTDKVGNGVEKLLKEKNWRHRRDDDDKAVTAIPYFHRRTLHH